MSLTALSAVLDPQSKPSHEEDVQTDQEDTLEQNSTPPKMASETGTAGQLPAPPNPNKESLDNASQDIRDAVEEVTGDVVADCRLRYEGQSLDIATQLRQEIETYGDAILDFMQSKIVETLERDASMSLDREKQMAKRHAQRRVKQNASYYELLGIEPNANRTEISQARKQLMFALHPDRNQHDRAKFEELFKVIGGAGDALLDPQKRREHDEFLKRNPRNQDPSDPGEEFATNAFDDDDDDQDQEDEASDSEDEEASYPRPSKRVVQLHKEIGSKILEPLFGKLDSDIATAQLKDDLSNHNDQIRANNKEYQRADLDMFTVPFHKLLSCQYHQRTIIEYYKGGLTEPDTVQKKLQALQDFFVRTGKRGFYQWPEGWTALLMKPLRRRLGELKLPKEQTKTKPTPDKTAKSTHQDGPKPPTPDTGAASGVKGAAPGPLGGDPMQGVKHEGIELAGRPTPNDSKEIRELAYSSPPNGKFSSGFKLFVEVEGPNRLKVKTMRDVGLEDIYRCVKSDLPNVQTRRVNELHPDDLLEVKGVAWTDDRRYWTYVWAKRRTSDDEPIMTRTDFRKWQPNADWLIDQFIWDAGLIPTWAPEVLNSPFNPPFRSAALSQAVKEG
ncbi:uncharacterized protein PG998_000764 [Apiospora kogelbergensis]|uniref:uncharacterized protein n=1 Tax=Apiospora kogelbergensis TaxID=1337665 RepID=UPI0031303C05